MERSIIKHSVLCGLLMFAVNFFLLFSKAMFGVLICASILPGLIYAIVICDFHTHQLDLKRFCFIIFSGALYMLVAWIATGYSVLGNTTSLCFPFASVIGATLLFTSYFLLIDRSFSYLKGLLLAAIAGLISVTPAIAGDLLEQHIVDFDMKANTNLGFALLVLPVWQTLFGWIIFRLKNGSSKGRQ